MSAHDPTTFAELLGLEVTHEPYRGKVRRRQWSGLRMDCPICGGVMDQVIEGGRECYECPDCVHAFGTRQLDLLEGLHA